MAEISVQALSLLRLAGCIEPCPESLLAEARADRSGSLDARLDVLSIAEAEDILRRYGPYSGEYSTMAACFTSGFGFSWCHA
jgi:hypothetical protein